MSTLKTRKTRRSAVKLIQRLDNERRRADASVLLELFQRVANKLPVVWGESIIGFGEYHYRSSRSRQEGDWPVTGFAARKQNLVIYLMPGTSRYKPLLGSLGKHRTGVACLYINKLADIDLDVLDKLIRRSVIDMEKLYGLTA
jgi:hypothetical protein